MSRQNIRQLWLKLHRYLGLFLLLLSLPVGLTGSINVYHREIDRFLTPAFYTPITTQGQPLPLQQILEKVRQIDDSPIISIILPDDYWPVVLVHQRHGKIVLRTSIDPISGQILGRRDQSNALLPKLYKLHQDLLLRPYWGEELVGIAGMALALSSLSGLWLWFPRKALTVRKGQNFFRTTWDAHNALGFWVSLILLWVALSGTALVFPKAARFTLWPLNPREFKPHSVSHAEPAPPEDPDAILAAARAYRPDDVPLVLGLPTAKLNTWRVPMRPKHYHGTVGGLTQLWIDPWTLQVVQEKSSAQWTAGDRILAHQFPLHNGSLFGEAGRALVFLSGLAFPLLGISGAYLWWRKRRLAARKSSKPSRPASPPEQPSPVPGDSDKR
ncbi:MAG: PepSY domain-containing protein [Candidatus Eremiobacteraeota bacterium]|nr:PepSY domain-containing protein [Candidatus Eremiobacteraeota bacterium]